MNTMCHGIRPNIPRRLQAMARSPWELQLETSLAAASLAALAMTYQGFARFVAACASLLVALQFGWTSSATLHCSTRIQAEQACSQSRGMLRPPHTAQIQVQTSSMVRASSLALQQCSRQAYLRRMPPQGREHTIDSQEGARSANTRQRHNFLAPEGKASSNCSRWLGSRLAL